MLSVAMETKCEDSTWRLKGVLQLNNHTGRRVIRHVLYSVHGKYNVKMDLMSLFMST